MRHMQVLSIDGSSSHFGQRVSIILPNDRVSLTRCPVLRVQMRYEPFLIAGVVFYVACIIYGKTTNSRRANKWYVLTHTPLTNTHLTQLSGLKRTSPHSPSNSRARPTAGSRKTETRISSTFPQADATSPTYTPYSL